MPYDAQLAFLAKLQASITAKKQGTDHVHHAVPPTVVPNTAPVPQSNEAWHQHLSGKPSDDSAMQKIKNQQQANLDHFKLQQTYFTIAPESTIPGTLLMINGETNTIQQLTGTGRIPTATDVHAALTEFLTVIGLSPKIKLQTLHDAGNDGRDFRFKYLIQVGLLQLANVPANQPVVYPISQLQGLHDILFDRLYPLDAHQAIPSLPHWFQNCHCRPMSINSPKHRVAAFLVMPPKFAWGDDFDIAAQQHLGANIYYELRQQIKHDQNKNPLPNVARIRLADHISTRPYSSKRSSQKRRGKNSARDTVIAIITSTDEFGLHIANTIANYSLDPDTGNSRYLSNLFPGTLKFAIIPHPSEVADIEPAIKLIIEHNKLIDKGHHITRIPNLSRHLADASTENQELLFAALCAAFAPARLTMLSTLYHENHQIVTMQAIFPNNHSECGPPSATARAIIQTATPELIPTVTNSPAADITRILHGNAATSNPQTGNRRRSLPVTQPPPSAFLSRLPALPTTTPRASPTSGLYTPAAKQAAPSAQVPPTPLSFYACFSTKGVLTPAVGVYTDYYNGVLQFRSSIPSNNCKSFKSLQDAIDHVRLWHPNFTFQGILGPLPSSSRSSPNTFYPSDIPSIHNRQHSRMVTKIAPPIQARRPTYHRSQPTKPLFKLQCQSRVPIKSSRRASISIRRPQLLGHVQQRQCPCRRQ
jgi:hypothetical protein